MLSKRFSILIFVLVALVALVAACGPGGGGGGGGAVNLTVNGSEFKFDPATLNVNAGQSVTVTLKNTGSVKHTFVLKEANVNIVADPGQSASATFTAPAAGSYTFLCDQPGHQEAGMKGTLIVK